MNRKDILEKALPGLLEMARLREDEVTSRYRKALTPAYWEKLNPNLSVGEDGARDLIETLAIDLQHQNELLDQFAEEGYFQAEPIISHSAIERMRESVGALRRENWPPIFTFVYDQFWLVSRVPSLVRLLSAILGSDYRQNCHIWTHYVHPHTGAAGWKPHVDNPRRSNRLTVWTALSEATLNNGCLYLIPKSLSPKGIAESFTKLQTVNRVDLGALLQSSRALPARAGAMICWESEVIHWGSICHKVGDPRISISMEFIGEHSEPADDELPLLDPHSPLPTFAQRLHAIGQAILAYQKFDPLMIRYVDLAKLLVEHAGSI